MAVKSVQFLYSSGKRYYRPVYCESFIIFFVKPLIGPLCVITKILKTLSCGDRGEVVMGSTGMFTTSFYNTRIQEM